MTESQVEYNSDELSAPAWLNNEEFFTKVLQTCERDTNVKVKNIIITPAAVKGDHFASVMFRAKVEFEHGDGASRIKSMIIKIMPQMEGLKMDFLKDSRVFETEIGMYTEVLPKFEVILRAAGDDCILGAPCLFYSFKPHKIIIFEDLVPLGYSVLSNRIPTLEQLKAIYGKLAKLHAVGYKLAEERTFFAKYGYGIMAFKDAAENSFFKSGFTHFCEMLQTEPTLKKYLPYFEAMKKSYTEVCYNSFMEYHVNPQPNGFYGMCHGDFHIKNMMFKHAAESGKFLDVMLIDYQSSYVGPPINDLIYSFYLILDRDQRENHLTEFLQIYLDALTGTLEKIGFKGYVPTLEELHAQRLQSRHFEMFVMLCFYPLWYADIEDITDLDKIMTSAEYRRTLFYKKDFIKDMREILEHYEALHFFENL